MKIMVAEIYDGYNKDSTYVLVYKNPQSQEVSELGNYFRGIIDESGNVYAWNKQEFIHNDAQKQFNIPQGLYITWTLNRLLIVNDNYDVEQLVSIIRNAKSNLSFLSDTTRIRIQNNNKNDSKSFILDNVETLADVYQYSAANTAKKKSRLRKLAK